MTTITYSEPVRVSWDCGAGPDEVYTGRLVLEDGRPQLWNGFVVPMFDRAEAERLATYNNGLDPDVSADKFRWDGDTLMSQYGGGSPDWPDEPWEPIAPVIIGGEPYWCIGGWAWTWTTLDGPGCRFCGWFDHLPTDRVSCPSCGLGLDGAETDVEYCADCGHPTDDHDRRAEDSDCLACPAERPCPAMLNPTTAYVRATHVDDVATDSFDEE